MVNNLLLAKVGGGLVTVGSVGGLGYAYRDFFKNLFDGKNLHFLIVQAKEVSGTKPSDKKLFDSAKKETKYKCKKDDEIDETCQIFKLDELKNNFLGFNSLKNFDESKLDVNQDDLAKDNFLKVQIDKNKFKNIDFGTDFVIDIETNDASITANKIHGQLKVIAKIEGNTVTSNNKWIIAKVKTANTIESSYKCYIGPNNSQEVSCKIHKIVDTAPVSTDSLSFSNTKDNGNAETTFTANGWYFINFSDETTNKKELKMENFSSIIAYKKADSGATAEDKKTTFIDPKIFVGKIDNTTPANNKIFLLG